MILKNFFSIVFLLCLTDQVKSQTCESIYPSSPCSSNAACGCIPLVFTDDIGICGVSSVNCARLNPCDADFGCPSTNQICVSHSRCGSTPVCYPMSMTDARLCPPMPSTTTATTPSFFTTEGSATFETTSNGFNYDSTSTFYTSGTNGPFETATDGFTENETVAYFTANTTDYDYSTAATSPYPTNWVLSSYSSALTVNSSLNPNDNKYYELLQIRVNTSGQYQIRSVSNMDTYGCINDETYNSSEPTNTTNCNDDRNGNQFQLDAYLEAGISYTLLFTTFASKMIGPYTVEVYGEDVVEIYRIDVEQVTTTAFPTNETETETNATTYGSSVISMYSSSLTDNSSKYPQFSRYYEAINVTVNTSGFYTFRSEEILDGMGYLYRQYFNSSDETQNLLVQDDQSGGNNQFSFTVYLEVDVSYVLVFTTYGANVNGRFTIIVSGPASVGLTRADSFTETSTGVPFEFTTNSMMETTSYTNGSSIIISEYSSELTIYNNYFDRPFGSGGNFYYEAIEIKTNTLGFYTFISQQNSSGFLSANDSSMSYEIIDTFGVLYNDTFSPLSPSMNVLQADDDGASNRQFRLMHVLETDKTYVIVFTTFNQNTTGSFSIKATGPDYVNFTRLNI